MAALPEPPNDSTPPHWDYWRHDLWERGQNDAAANFWNWPAVRHTMLVEHFPIGPQLAHLKTDWARWETALSGLVNEKHMRNMVNQAYHVKLWEDTTGRRIEQLSSIFEFGGGYGALAHLARRMGFVGRYLIYDLPEFALLQKWFLAEQWVVGVEHVDGPRPADLFVALYSLSETPVAVRQAWDELASAGSYLLLYSGRWAQHDNHAWIKAFTERRAMEWAALQFSGRPDWYAIGGLP